MAPPLLVHQLREPENGAGAARGLAEVGGDGGRAAAQLLDGRAEAAPLAGLPRGADGGDNAPGRIGERDGKGLLAEDELLVLEGVAGRGRLAQLGAEAL